MPVNMKKLHISLAIRKIQIITSKRYPFINMKLAKKKKPDNIEYWR